jgi:GNAT superfamily N-acetyltransferase
VPASIFTEIDNAGPWTKCVQSTVYLDSSGRREEIGWGLAMIDQSAWELLLLRLDVLRQYRRQGYGFAQVLALLQRARTAGLPDTARVRLIADEAETPQLRRYFVRIGFSRAEDQEDEGPEQYAMSASFELLLLHLQLELRRYGEIHYKVR